MSGTLLFLPELPAEKRCQAKHPGHGNVTCTKLAGHADSPYAGWNERQHSNGHETWAALR